MTRLIGPDEACREVKTIVTGAGVTKGLFKSKALKTATYYTDPDQTATPTVDMLTELADILDLDDAAITDSTVTIDAYSMLPLMQFPDDVDSLLIVVDNGPPWRVYAREDDRLDSLATGLAAETTARSAGDTSVAAAAATDATTKASAAQAAAISAAATDATTKVATEATARAAAVSAEATSRASGDTAAIATAATDATAKVAAHSAATTSVHGITDTAALVRTSDIPVVYLAGTGIDKTGATDSTSAMQAIITAAPTGSTIVAGPGIYKFSTLTVTDGKRLAGLGWKFHRDALVLFGAANYGTSTYFGGTVFRSTATSGLAITVTTVGVNTNGSLADFILVGPGSGTSTGIYVGNATTPGAVLNGDVNNVMVCNFATGWTLGYVEEGRFRGMGARGCTNGVKLLDNTNNCTFDLLDIECCVTGLTDTALSLGNVFTGMIGQANTGTSVTLLGVNEQLVGGYFENISSATGWAIDVAGGDGNIIQGVQLNKSTDGIRVQSGARNTVIVAPTSAGTIPITVAGVATYLVGEFVSGFTLTDTGTHTVIVNTGTGTVTADGVTVGKDTQHSPILNVNGAAGFGRQVSYQTASVNRWITRAGAGAESGANAGSDFEIVGRADDGSLLHTTTARRSDGRWTFPSIIVPTAVAPSGLTGATTAARFVGGTSSAAPASGTFAVGDYVVTAAGSVRVCTVAGSPGTWVNASNVVDVITPAGLTGATTAARFVGGTTSGAPVTGTFAVNDYVVSSDGNFYLCTVAGSPGTWVTLGTPAALNALAANSLTTGEIVPSRDDWLTNAVATASGVVYLTYFTADKSETITTLTTWSGGTAAAATPTLCRMGVYSVDGSGNLTLVASTPNDTTLFAATNTAYAKATSASWSKTVGQRYAHAVLVVSGGTMPTFVGKQLSAVNAVNTAVRLAPATIGRLLSQTDLPSSIAVGSLVGYQANIAMQMS